jgi:endonuclease G, mitochondrial
MAARRSDDDPNLQPLINAFFRLNPFTQFVVVLVLLIAAFIAYKFYRNPQQLPTGSDGSNSPSLVLGNPSNATSDSSNGENYLMVKPYYALSFNQTKGTPNWVSWCVTESDLGTAPRKDEFDEDNTLPMDFYHVTQHDYSSSGFDRGHMCPHSDRAANQEMSFSTFVMTNIIPQAPNVNRKAWAQMEDYCREQVRHHDRLYIIAGPVGQGGRGSEGFRKTLADGRVTVPSACWKIVVDIPDDGTNDASRIGSDARVLSVEMPNNNEIVGEEWAQYRVTPAQIEQETGLHFFTKLKPEIANAFRQRLDRMPLPKPRPLMH